VDPQSEIRNPKSEIDRWSPPLRLFSVCPECASPIPPDWQGVFARESRTAVLVDWIAGWCAHCAKWWVIRRSRPRADAHVPRQLRRQIASLSGVRMTGPRPARLVEAGMAERAVFGRRGLTAPVGSGT